MGRGQLVLKPIDPGTSRNLVVIERLLGHQHDDLHATRTVRTTEPMPHPPTLYISPPELFSQLKRHVQLNNGD
jgi:hypothetical protein